MMLAYDDAAPSEELLRIETDEIGTYFPQVGAWLERRGYDTTFISAHPKLFTEQAKDYTDDELIEHIKSYDAQSEQDENVRSYFEDYVLTGGTIRYAIPSIDIVKEYIDAGRPIGASATTHFRTGEEPGFNFHFFVVTGYDDEYIYVNDPHPDFTEDGTTAYTYDEFRYAVLATTLGDLDNGSLFAVQPE
jgi:hypothetical protein